MRADRDYFLWGMPGPWKPGGQLGQLGCGAGGWGALDGSQLWSMSQRRSMEGQTRRGKMEPQRPQPWMA